MVMHGEFDSSITQARKQALDKRAFRVVPFDSKTSADSMNTTERRSHQNLYDERILIYTAYHMLHVIGMNLFVTVNST